MKARTWALLAFFLLALLGGLADRALVRDGDQGAMLAGALRMAEGGSPLRPGFYAYDRSWLSYGLTAGLFRLAGIGRGSAEAVITANTFNFVLYWFAWLLLVARLPPGRGYRTAVWCVLAAPVSLLASIYWNVTALSSAFVALGILAFMQPGRGRTLAGAGCFAAAAGMRVDVLLLAPLAVWLFVSPRLVRGRITLNRVLRNRGLAAAGAMTAAAFTGRYLAGGRAAMTDLYFDPLVVLGYVVFAAGSIAALCAMLTAGWRARRGTFRTGLFSVVGLVALLLPWVFYLPQLHSPRYLMRAGEAALLLLASPRGRAWLRRPFGGSVRRHLGLAALAALPLVVGVHFISPLRPRITVTEPTLMPTGDGLMPMGAVTSFLARMRRASVVPVDHNQMLWQAIGGAEFPAAGPWRVLRSPQMGLFDLRAALEGAVLEPVDASAASRRPGVTAETRMLMRRDPKQPEFDEAAVLLSTPAVRVSPCIQGLFLVRFGAGDRSWSRSIRLLRGLFNGAEYRIRPATDPPAPAGHATVFFAEGPFRVVKTRRSGSPQRIEARPAGEGYYVVILRPGRHRSEFRLEAPDRMAVHRADSALPAWMTR